MGILWLGFGVVHEHAVLGDSGQSQTVGAQDHAARRVYRTGATGRAWPGNYLGPRSALKMRRFVPVHPSTLCGSGLFMAFAQARSRADAP